MQYARRMSQNFSRRTSKVSVSPEKDLFYSIIQDAKGKKLFLAFMQRTNSLEMFYFYENVMTFKKTLKQLEDDRINVATDKLRQAASRIIDSYIKDGATMFIPMDVTCKLDVLQRYADGDIHSNLFDEALDDHIVKLGILIGQQFMQSEEGQKYVDQYHDFESF